MAIFLRYRQSQSVHHDPLNNSDQLFFDFLFDYQYNQGPHYISPQLPVHHQGLPQLRSHQHICTIHAPKWILRLNFEYRNELLRRNLYVLVSELE